MALYFTSKLQPEGRPLTGQLATHPTLPLIATGWSQNKVTVCAEDGSRLASIAHNSAPTMLRWHPTLRLLAIGWRDGTISLWNEEAAAGGGNHTNNLEAPQHGGLAVVALEWTTHGTYLLTAAKSGAIVLWQLEGENRAAVLWGVESDFPVSLMSHLSFPVAKGGTGGEDDDPMFLVGGGTNQIYYLDDLPTWEPIITLDADVDCVAMLWDKQKRQVLCMTSANTIAQFYIDFDMKVQTLFTRKVAAGPASDLSVLQMIQVAPGLIAFSCGEGEMKLMNLEQDVMYTLPFPSDVNTPNPKISTLCALESHHLLAAGAKEGRITMWGYTGGKQSTETEDWQQLASMEADQGSIEKVAFTAAGTVAALQPDAAAVMQETTRKRKWSGMASAVQVSPDTVVVEMATGEQTVVKSKSTVKELDLSYPMLSLWNGRSCELWTVSDGNSTLAKTFDQATQVIGLHAEGMIVGQNDRLLFLDYQGTQLHEATFAGSEGVPQHIDVLGDFCVVVTSQMMMKVFRVGTRQLRQLGPARPLKQAIGDGRIVTQVRVNSRGKKVAMMTKATHSAREDSMIWVYDLDTDLISNNDFAELNQEPVALYWNTSGSGVTAGNDFEHLLLCCETKNMNNKETAPEGEEHGKEGESTPQSTNHVWTLFATSTSSVVPHHSFSLDRDQLCLLGCTVPNLLICNAKGGTLIPAEHKLEIKRLRDFEGMQADTDTKLRDALMTFSYHATCGNMDEAYRAVKAVKDTSVWHNLAKLCIATKRVDVAEVCLANMGDGLAARTLREARTETDVEAKLGILSIALGCPEDAERIFKAAKRNDLLTELYVAAGRWEDAEGHTEAYDRIRIQPVKYRHAQFLERSGNVEGALRLYEQTNCFGAEAPRMMYQLNRLEELRHTVASSQDKDLNIWWAQYLESAGDVDGALQQYKQAKDAFNAIRLLVAANPPRLEEAIDTLGSPEARETPGAAFFVAQAYEQIDINKAMRYYNQAKAYRHAIRLAKENEMFADILSLALLCEDKAVALDCAGYFESRQLWDKAVQLYQRGGDTTRAIDVCIKGGLYDALHQISETLDSAADPETFISMAEHFINSEHFDKAAQMLVFAKAFNESLQLCMDKGVKLSDQMAEAMTLPKTDNEEDEAYRISLLKKIAKVAKTQGSFSLACKKYTQAGERVKAMKMLLQSGDTEKVIFFANHSRNQEIYQLAGNYLQAQDWQRDAALYKSIVTFYTKAKAYDQLAGFYDMAAQVQIDEYRDYDKALATLQEADRILAKAEGAGSSLTKRQLLTQRIELADTFVQARKMIKPGEPCPQMVSMCQELLAKGHRDHPMREVLETAIRLGDVYALLVEYYDKLGQTENAYALIEKMMDSEIELSYFLEDTLCKKIFAAMGKDPAILTQVASGNNQANNNAGSGVQQGGGDDDDDMVEDDFIDEEV